MCNTIYISLVALGMGASALPIFSDCSGSNDFQAPGLNLDASPTGMSGFNLENIMGKFGSNSGSANQNFTDPQDILNDFAGGSASAGQGNRPGDGGPVDLNLDSSPTGMSGFDFSNIQNGGSGLNDSEQRDELIDRLGGARNGGSNSQDLIERLRGGRGRGGDDDDDDDDDDNEAGFSGGTEDSGTDTGLGDVNSEILAMINDHRTSIGLNALTTNREELQPCFRSLDAMIQDKIMDHNVGGTSPQDRGADGENIAFGQQTPKEVFDEWMESDGHRANIENANYTGVATCAALGENTELPQNGIDNYWSQSFFV